MLTTSNTVDTNTVEFVKLGTAVSTHFTVGIRNYATFRAVMDAIPDRNAFRPGRVADTFGDKFADAMSVEFGAAGSPVLYVTIPFFDHQRLGSTTFGMGEKYTPEQRHKLTRRVIDWGCAMRADEIDVRQHPAREGIAIGKPGDNPYKVRLWWD